MRVFLLLDCSRSIFSRTASRTHAPERLFWFQTRTGRQWADSRSEAGSYSTVHHWMSRWTEAGVFRQVFESLVREADGLGLVDWNYQCVDRTMLRARFCRGGDANGIGLNPTDRAPQRNKNDRYRKLDKPLTQDEKNIRGGVERCHAWMTGSRAVLTRHARKLQNYEAQCYLTAIFLWWRRIERAEREKAKMAVAS